MRKKLATLSSLLLIFCTVIAQKSDSITLNKIAYNVLENGVGYENLRYLCKKIGPRLSGSQNAEKSVWATFKMLKDAGADTVYLQECMVPAWKRGDKEIATITAGGKLKMLNVCALGMSIGTGALGIKAPVIEVKNFAELDALGEAGVKGKIVFFNYQMRNELLGYGYRDAVAYRSNGPSRAAKLGAVAIMIRSVTYNLDNNPHTGATRYDSLVKKIPAIACGTLDANWLSNTLKTNKNVQLYIRTTCTQGPDVKSYNVIGELRGIEHPEEIITVGGHLDSWDLAEGAHDDGAGVMQSVEVINTLHALGIKPKRTIRAVMFMNEENGLRGGNKYAEVAEQKKEKMIFAIESDSGGFGADEIGFSGTAAQYEKFKTWLPLFQKYNIYNFGNSGGGADIGPLKKFGTALAGLEPNSQRYFDFHHAPNDVFENVNKREFEMGAFAMTAICWLVSEYGL